MNTFIAPLHGLRGMAALAVVFAHSQRMTHIPIQQMAGAMGVMLFFSLSGFLMAYLYLHKEPTTVSIRDYVRARIARIYPLFTVVCVMSAVIYYSGGTDFLFYMNLQQLVMHLLGAGAGYTIWTISTEFQFYALFVLFWLSYSLLGTNKRILFSLLIIGLIISLWLSDFSSDRIAINGYLHVFASGMLVAVMLPYLQRLNLKRISGIALSLLLLVFFVAYYVTPVTIGSRCSKYIPKDTSPSQYIGRILSSLPIHVLAACVAKNMVIATANTRNIS